jgi:hypothetical protein
MYTQDKNGARGRNRSRLSAVGITLLLATSNTACEDLLQVDLPTKVAAENLDNPSVAEVLVNSAIGEFECAFSQFVAASGQLTDELRHSSGWLVMTEWDHRKIGQDRDVALCNGNFGYGVFTPMQKARVSAESSRMRIEGWDDADVSGRPEKIAVVATYGAISRAILGEAFCEMTIDVGPIMPKTEMLQNAEAALGEAMSLAQAAGRADLAEAARIRRAGVRLTLGDNSGAMSDAAAVSEGFRYDANYSAADLYRYNRIYHHNHVDGFLSPEFNDESGQPTVDGDNPTFGGVVDPRVESTLSGIGQDGSPLRLIHKYPAWTSPIAIANSAEAQLIIAEVELGQTAVDIINKLHAAAGLPPFEPANVADNAEIMAHVMQERTRELFLEGRRLNDFLRHGLPFATGTHPYDGNTYGTTTCIEIPRREKDSNPNI